LDWGLSGINFTLPPGLFPRPNNGNTAHTEYQPAGFDRFAGYTVFGEKTKAGLVTTKEDDYQSATDHFFPGTRGACATQFSSAAAGAIYKKASRDCLATRRAGVLNFAEAIGGIRRLPPRFSADTTNWAVQDRGLSWNNVSSWGPSNGQGQKLGASTRRLTFKPGPCAGTAYRTPYDAQRGGGTRMGNLYPKNLYDRRKHGLLDANGQYSPPVRFLAGSPNPILKEAGHYSSI